MIILFTVKKTVSLCHSKEHWLRLRTAHERLTHLCVAPTKHLGFKPARTQEALSQARPATALLPLPSSTSAAFVDVFVCPVTFFTDALADTELLGSGADKRLTFDDLSFAAAERTSELSSDVLLSCWFSSLTLQHT